MPTEGRRRRDRTPPRCPRSRARSAAPLPARAFAASEIPRRAPLPARRDAATPRAARGSPRRTARPDSVGRAPAWPPWGSATLQALAARRIEQVRLFRARTERDLVALL